MTLHLAIVLAVTGSANVPVDVGKFDANEFPNLIKLERTLPHGEMTNRVEKMLDRGACRLPSQSSRRFDIVVPYAALLDTSGTAKKVVVGEVGCAPLEVLVGQVVLAQAARKDFKVQHLEGDRWYVSELYFSQTEQTTPMATSSMAEPDKVICQRAKPVPGSRVATQKICRTAAEWRAVEGDRQQVRRDMQNAAKDFRKN